MKKQEIGHIQEKNTNIVQLDLKVKKFHAQQNLINKTKQNKNIVPKIRRISTKYVPARELLSEFINND